ncbi:pyruvate formate-lyase-activating protein [Nocardioides sp. T2.26MG-1]|uniref:pyruvate formate-lyase-activating protein n=1 Tax=Nocardioides sp. T2.26MG-1 TaxID=3041166 RepID=UPI002477B442|nr:pyruvate formate-lyase-activating protein [Nocardioides sp. T2.26MG-1]CAI9411247.1 Pyruvate formate-lyase 1-activating enzyme [Nocardioides sp. T2.26MG-1]
MTVDLCAATPEAEQSAPAGSVTGSVHSWDISTGVDGPGTRFVLFTAGCPLACAYCHNPDTQDMRYGTRRSADEVLTRIGRYRGFIAASGGGVTVSGGEPLLQPAFTSAVLRGAKDLGLHTALDTSGALGERASDELLDATDLVLLDVKAIDPAIYENLTRFGLTPTLRFAERLATLGKRVWIRYVLVPGWNDEPEHLERHAAYVATLGNVERVDVLGYHRLGREKYAQLGMEDRLAGVDGATPAQVRAARDVFTAAGLRAP